MTPLQLSSGELDEFKEALNSEHPELVSEVSELISVPSYSVPL
jgi:hypothetical protein